MANQKSVTLYVWNRLVLRIGATSGAGLGFWTSPRVSYLEVIPELVVQLLAFLTDRRNPHLGYIVFYRTHLGYFDGNYNRAFSKCDAKIAR